MKETGLMFKAPLVRAILEGRKTQTRRVVKRLPLRINRDANAMEIDVANIENGEFAKRVPCPMGQPGDRIYVRETFVQGYKVDPATGAPHDCDEEGNDIPMSTWYRATDGGITWSDDDGWETNVPWKPAIHMPKALARIWLEVTGVRVETLGIISHEDALAEGVSSIEEYKALWININGAWLPETWVWVVDFRMVLN